MGQALPKQTTTFKQPQQQHALSSSSSAPSPPSLFAAFSLSHARPALATTEIPSVLSAADTQEELCSSYPAAAACPDADDIAPASAFETITLKACLSAENFRSTPTALGLYPSTPPHRRVKRTGSVSDVPISAEAFQSTSAALWSSAFPASSSSVPSSSLAADRAQACPPGQEPPSLPAPSLVMARSKALAPACDNSDVATTPAAGSGANLTALANPTEHSPNGTANIPAADIPSATSANGNGIAAPASPAETPAAPSGPSSQTRQPFQPPQISSERMVLDFVASQTAALDGPPSVQTPWLPRDIAHPSFAATQASAAQTTQKYVVWPVRTGAASAFAISNNGLDHLDITLSPPDPTNQPLGFDPVRYYNEFIVGTPVAPNVMAGPYIYVDDNQPPFRSRTSASKPTFKPIKPLPKRKLKAAGAGSASRRPVPAATSALSSSAPTGSTTSTFAAAFHASSSSASVELPASPNTNRKRGLPGSGPSESDAPEPGPPLSFSLVNGNGPSQSSIFQFEAYLASRVGQLPAQATAASATSVPGAGFRPSSAPPVSSHLPHKFVWTDPTAQASESAPNMDFGGASAVHATGQQSGPPPPPSDTSGTANTWHLPQSANNPAASSPGRNPSVVNQSFRPNFANSTTPFNPSTPSGNATPGLSTHSPQATLSSSAAAELRELERDQDAIDYFNVQHLTDLPPLVDDEELSRMFAADAAARERLAEASNSATPAPAATAAPAAVGGSLAVPGPTTPKSRKKKKKKGAVDALHPTSPGTGTQSGGAVQQRPQANAAGSTTTAGGGTTTAASHAHATAAAAGSAAAAPPPPRAPASASPFLSQDTGTIFDKFRKPISNYRARTARYEKEAKLGQHAAAAADWHCWFCEYEQAYGGKLWRGGGKGRGRKAAVDVAAPAGGSGRKVRDGAAVTVPPPPPNGKQAGEGMSVPTTTTTTTATVAAAGKQAPSPARVQQQQHAHAPSRPMVSKASA